MRLESVSFRYARRRAWVIDRATLDLRPGTVTAITGGNGSGKSTLLKVAAGLVRPTSGSVRGRPSRIGYVPERLPADMRLSARSYLLHMGRIQGIGTATASRRSNKLLDELGVEGDLKAPVSTLSKGNAQKVALAQSLLADPQLLVLDEPWSGLDTRTHRTLMSCLADQRAAGVVVLLTEHRPGAVAASADAVYRIHRGQLAEHRVDETLPSPETLAIELGTTAVTSEPVEAITALPGVVALGETAGVICLEVIAERSDQVLAEALRHGYTVRRVHPTGTASSPRRVADDPIALEGGHQ